MYVHTEIMNQYCTEVHVHSSTRSEAITGTRVAASDHTGTTTKASYAQETVEAGRTDEDSEVRSNQAGIAVR